MISSQEDQERFFHYIGALGGGTKIVPSTGPTDAELMFIAETPGTDETLTGVPLVGASGKLLRARCSRQGIDFDATYRANVFPIQPPQNKLEQFFTVPRSELPPDYPLTKPIYTGKYPRPELLPFVDILKKEIDLVRPRLIVALGNVACWFLFGETGITRMRGYFRKTSILGEVYDVLPTFHPAAALRNYASLAFLTIDLNKAKSFLQTGEVAIPPRKIYIPEAPHEVLEWLRTYLEEGSPSAWDVETKGPCITMISVSPDPSIAMVVPLINEETNEHWWSFEDEVKIIGHLYPFLTNPAFPKIFHNGLYDTARFWRDLGIPLRGWRYDTMLMHHTLQPEMKKDLGTLGATYTLEAQWKHIRKHGKKET